MKICGAFCICLFFPFIQYAQETEYNHVFFDNSLMEESWFYGETSYTSPSHILNIQGRLPVNTDVAFTPGNSLHLNYRSAPEGTWKVNLKYPDWRGKDFLKEGDMLSFWLYVANETQKDNLPEIAIGLDEDKLSNFIQPGKYISDYSEKKWMQVKLPLAEFTGSEALANSNNIKIISVKQSPNDVGKNEILIDQVEIINEEKPYVELQTTKIRSAEGFERHVDLSWELEASPATRYVKIYRSHDNKNFTGIGVQSPDEFSRYVDYTGVPGKTYYYKLSSVGYDYTESPLTESTQVSTREMSDEELLDMVQEASFRYYWEGAEVNSGLALENIPGRRNMIATGASGFGIMALIVGAERGFITKDEFITRMEKIVRFVENGDRFHGALPHFMDGPTGKVEAFFGKYDDGADLVETSFFMQGLLAAEQYLSEDDPEENNLRNRISVIWKEVEWDWFKQHEDSPYLYWHWSPEHEWHINHKLIGWNETMITYFLAIASPTHGISPEMYYSGWASQDTIAKNYRSNWGQTSEGSMYANDTSYFGVPLEVGVGVGGPLFFTHYSFLGLDPMEMEDKYTNYFDTNKSIVSINYRYSLENPGNYEGYGKNSWGLTASDGPWGYKAREAKPEMDDGTIAPTGAIASFPYTPEKSMDALKHFYREYGSFLWGEYGFRDAFNLSEDWTANIFMGLNQAPMVVMIENHRSGLIWDLFMKNENVQEALKEIKKIED
ncbi:hypothetical protein LB467_01575 [Salegentibacter sp. JZCK2]|uniref:glucoamylase family protein n=1 Tax=Salegentibacter tibetensis TaxID=2873600 RepID=UPI001CC9A4C0|nr:glucoamylase family protein [Salegentibacter tibetensis]MBZ9728365.1 hypothetical protein [Salegentibacter tibetensis]